jgi:mxaA protein
VIPVAVPPAALVEAVVEQPRPFGYVIGDILEQRVLLEAGGRRLEPRELPHAGRVGIWLERRPPRIVAGANGRRWLAVDYQLINAPQGLTTVNLPAWQMLSIAGGQAGPALAVPSWPISVGPLTGRTVIAQGGLQELRADRPAPTIPTAPLVDRLRSASGALLATVLAWIGWVVVRNRRAASARPFARASRELRALDDAAPEAWRALHRAFDATAGQVIQQTNVTSLFQRAPQLEPLRPRIEEFFRYSTEWFFAGTAPEHSVRIHELCADLLRLERRFER